MLSFEEVYKIAEERLSEYRFYHSKCVMEKAEEYARVYGADVEKAKIAGIAHDIAKEVSKDEILSECEKYGVILDEIEKENKSLIHGKLGAKIAEIDFGYDEEICDAIRYHTTGRANMSLLEKIILVADCTGADREYDNAKYMHELALESLDKAIIYYYKVFLQDRLENEKIIHPDAINAYNYLVK